VCNVEIILQYDEQSRSYLSLHLLELTRGNKAVFTLRRVQLWVSLRRLTRVHCIVNSVTLSAA